MPHKGTCIVEEVGNFLKDPQLIFQHGKYYYKEAFSSQFQLNVSFRLPFVVDPSNRILFHRPSPFELAYEGMVFHVLLVPFQFVIWDNESRLFRGP